MARLAGFWGVIVSLLASLALVAVNAPAARAGDSPVILTPPPPDSPRINGPGVYGERPGRPFLYRIPATGKRPITFAADTLPQGLTLDATTGEISGKIDNAGEFQTTLRAANNAGSNEKKFKIVIGDRVALTPPMGWNSWNCWAKDVDADKVLAS